MKIKYGLILFCLAIALQLPVAFSHTVEAGQIIVAEPVGAKMSSDQDVLLNVNITNTQIVSEPVHVVVTRQLSRLPFADELGSKLQVSLLRLIPHSSAASDAIAIYPTEPIEYSEDYREEILLINRYFALKNEIAGRRAQMRELDKKYQLEEAIRQGLTKMPTERANALQTYRSLREAIGVAVDEHDTLEARYARYFEEIVLSDRIDKMSYYQFIGRLESGSYRIRFLDSGCRLIKETALEIVDDVKPDGVRLP